MRIRQLIQLLYIIIKRDVLIQKYDSHRQGAQQEGSKNHPWIVDDGVVCALQETSTPQRQLTCNAALGLEDYKLIVKKPTDLNLIRRQNNEGKYKFVEEILD